MASPDLDLVARYIAAVKFWLPAELREDVAAELAEDIRSEIDEAEKAKGRPLTSDEIAAILKARGTPLSVAARYQPQRHLIGPEMFPLYIFVLKIVAVICLIPSVLACFLWILDGYALPVPGTIASPLNGFLLAFAVVTIVFAIIEYKGIDLSKRTDWNPNTLRPVIDKNRIPRSDSVGEIIGALVAIGIFAAGYLSQTTYHFPAGGSITVAPEWIPFWQIMIALAVVGLALAAVNLFKPYWAGLRVLAWLVINLGKTAAFCWLAQSHIVRAITGVPEPTANQLRQLSDKAADYALPFFAIVAAIVVVKAIWHILQAIRLEPAAA